MNQTDNMKNVSNSKENNLQADVVIVGTGVGGCFSALNLSEDLSIIMITKLLLSPKPISKAAIHFSHKEESVCYMMTMIMTVISKTQCGLVIMKTGKSL